MRKILGNGILAGILILIVSGAVDWIFRQIFPILVEQYSNLNLFRSMSDPMMSWYFAYPFILGIVLAWWWNLAKSNIVCNITSRACGKGMRFGMMYFFIAVVPGMFVTYVSMQVSFLMILSWSVGGLLSAIAAGLLFSRINK